MSVNCFVAVVATMMLVGSPMAMAQSVETRFGSVSIGRNVLMFRGKPVTPRVEGNNSLGLDKVLQVGASDDVIVRDNGGSGCPVMFWVVSVTAQSAKASPEFGTCSEGADVSVKGNSVSLAMPTVATLAQMRAGLGDPGHMHVFIVTNSVVTDNGKPVH